MPPDAATHAADSDRPHDEPSDSPEHRRLLSPPPSGHPVAPRPQPADTAFLDRYRGLLPEDVFDIIVCDGLHFDQARQPGTVFHVIGAVSEYGKLGMANIAGTPEAALVLHDRTIESLGRAMASG